MKYLFLLLPFLGGAIAGTVNFESFQIIIEKVNSLQTTWKADYNFPPHLTISSFKRLLGAKDSGKLLPVREDHVIPNSDIPEEFDARNKWPNCPTIGQIRDQGNCGSCWAVAAASVFTDRVCIATNGAFTMPLSDEEVLSCCSECGDGCNGGYTEIAWDFFSTNGLVTGGGYNTSIGCQPYDIQACEHHTSGELPQCSSLPAVETPECETRCTNPTYETTFENDHHSAESGYILRNDVSEIQKEILINGPVTASFSVYSDFPTYKSGVYQHVAGTHIGGHAVRIIGWGKDNGTDYWLVANSWNTHWGEGGLFKIRRGVNECGIENKIVAGIPLINK